MAWRKTADPFPGPLREFREEDWPPVDGECLSHYSCRDRGYGEECVSIGGPCGWRSYAMIITDFPGDVAMLARWRRADAYTRWRKARLGWLASSIGEDDPRYVEEWVAGMDDGHEIRYGRRMGA